MIRGVAAILDGSEGIEIWKWAAGLDVSRTRGLDLIWVGHALQVSALRSGVGKFKRIVAGRALHRKVPALVVGGMQARVHTGHRGSIA